MPSARSRAWSGPPWVAASAWATTLSSSSAVDVCDRSSAANFVAPASRPRSRCSRSRRNQSPQQLDKRNRAHRAVPDARGHGFCYRRSAHVPRMTAFSFDTITVSSRRVPGCTKNGVNRGAARPTGPGQRGLSLHWRAGDLDRSGGRHACFLRRVWSPGRRWSKRPWRQRRVGAGRTGRDAGDVYQINGGGREQNSQKVGTAASTAAGPAGSSALRPVRTPLAATGPSPISPIVVHPTIPSQAPIACYGSPPAPWPPRAYRTAICSSRPKATAQPSRSAALTRARRLQSRRVLLAATSRAI